MDAARAADFADPAKNLQFSRRWTGPPQKRERRRENHHPAPHFEFHSDHHRLDTRSDQAAQRAIAHAAARVGSLRHRARMLRGIGQRDAAMRLAALADAILVEVLA